MPEQIPEMAVRIRQAHVTALLHVDCDCDCDDCNLGAVAVLAMPEMRAIKTVLRYHAKEYSLARQAVGTSASKREILSAWGLPDVVVEWVLS